MGILNKTRQFGQAVKNVHRLHQIVRVFAKHGFAEFVERMGLQKFIPRTNDYLNTEKIDFATHLRLAFEELGPTFIKLGQLLATRSDVLAENFIEEFTKLQDHVQNMPFETVKQIVEHELKKKISDIFESFDEKCLAAASIAQVHAAELKTGEQVVVKIQRPEIEKIIETDISLLEFLAAILEKTIPESRVFNPKILVQEFFKTLSFELDFLVEANNMIKIKQNFSAFEDIVIPKAFREHCTKKILVLEKLEGIPLNQLDKLETTDSIDKKKIVEIGAHAFIKSIMIDGLFHGDLHGGNLFILSNNKLGIIDFGIVGRLSQRSRDQLAAMVMSLMIEDYENLCYEYAELGTVNTAIDFELFQRKVRNILSPYMGLSLSELNIGKILIQATRIATEFNIKIPGDWMLVFKAIVTIESLGKKLDPAFDLLATGEVLIKNVMKQQYSLERLTKESIWIFKDLANLLKMLPRQIRWMLKKFGNNNFAFEIKSPELQLLQAQIKRLSNHFSLSIIASFCFLSGSICLHYQDNKTIFGIPFIAMCFFSLGGFTFLLFFWSFSKRS